MRDGDVPVEIRVSELAQRHRLPRAGLAKAPRPNRGPEFGGEVFGLGFRIDVAAQMGVEAEPIRRPAVGHLEVEMPGMSTFRPGPPGTSADFAEALVAVSLLHPHVLPFLGMRVRMGRRVVS